MKKRVIRQKNRRARRRWFMGSMVLVLFFTVLLLAASPNILPELFPDILTGTGQPEEAEGQAQGSKSANTDVPWYLTLVNKKNPIPENYQMSLVPVPGGEEVDERIYKPLMELLEASKEGNSGQPALVVSGYRTPEKQQSLYDDKVSQFRRQGYSEKEAKKLANQYVSLPGYSEHQLGFAVDINGATYDVYLWLQKNSYKYGFIFRYPGDKREITDAAEEVWHYRYVGLEAAKKIHEQGLCLEEYLRDRR